MAKALKPVPQEAPQDQPKPIIEYVGEGAEKVKFTINPKATRYVVHAAGMITEYL